MKRRALFIAAMLAACWVLSEGYALAKKPQFNGGCSSCGTPSVVNGGSVTAGSATTIVSTTTGVYRQVCHGAAGCERFKIDPSELRWEQHASDPDSFSLLYGSQEVGAYRPSTGKYFRKAEDGSFVAEPCEPPKPPDVGAVVQPIGAVGDMPQSVKAADGRELFFGVEPAKIDGKLRYSDNGKECSKETAYQAVGDGKASDLPDDANKLSFTVVGPKELHAKVKAALDSKPELRQYIVEQYYLPDAPMVKDLGFPTIGIQEGRTVLCTTDDTSPAMIEETIRQGLLRKRDPNLDPSKFPKAGDDSLAGIWKGLQGGQNLGYIVAAIMTFVGVIVKGIAK